MNKPILNLMDHLLNHLVFEKVDFINLVKGTKYLIIFKANFQSMIDIGTFDNYEAIDIDLFYVPEETANFINITCINDVNSHSYKLKETSYYDLNTRNFFRIIPQKERIQKEMEQRALNIILRNLIGDNTFKYNIIN